MAFVICTVIGKQTKHRLHTVAPLQPAGRAAVGIGRDFCVMLAVGCQTHDIIPVIVPQLRQVVAVKAGIVSEDGNNAILLKPGTKVGNGFTSGAEDRRHRCFDEQWLSYMPPIWHSMGRIWYFAAMGAKLSVSAMTVPMDMT